MSDKEREIEDDSDDKEVRRLMQEYGLDESVAERAEELINVEGFREDEAIEFAEIL